MTEGDRRRWDDRYRASGAAPKDPALPPPLFADLTDRFPTSGTALDLACGRGSGTAWLAVRGLHVTGFDISPIAIEFATDQVAALGVANRCTFQVVDLDHGLPDGPAVDLVLCYLFRDRRLDAAIVDRLAPGGLLAIAALSEVGAGPGRHRVPAGELRRAFGHRLDVVADGEGEGHAWLLGRSSRSEIPSGRVGNRREWTEFRRGAGQ